jgi:hypothetical protein
MYTFPKEREVIRKEKVIISEKSITNCTLLYLLAPGKVINLVFFKT